MSEPARRTMKKAARRPKRARKRSEQAPEVYERPKRASKAQKGRSKGLQDFVEAYQEATREQQEPPAGVPTLWAKAVDDVVGYTLAEQLRRFGVHHVLATALRVRQSVEHALPEAQRLFGEDPHEEGCSCRAYALIKVGVDATARMTGMAPQALFDTTARAFDQYIAGRN